MSRVKRMAYGVLIAVGLAAAIVACDGGPQEPVRGQGVVEDVDVADRKLTLDHDEIPGLMKPMIMTFDVAPGVAFDDLRVGDEISFWVKAGSGTYTVTEIRRPDE